tara:strand:- start:442 stop:1128 length:687 start_codon:yes stop_codon:yes gene_type:complete
LRIILKRILLKLPAGKRLWQITKATLLLRQRSFRQLFLKVNRNDVCIDLGANIGYASLVMWLKGSKNIYAIEPNIEAFNVLKENLEGIKNISVLNIAISSETGKENLFLHQDLKDKSDKKEILKLSQASSLLSDKTNVGNQFYEVQAKSLIDLFAEMKKSPTIIKCDIEGGEYIIYKQLVKCAKSFKIRKIFVECHAIRYPQYQNLHDEFMNLIQQNKLEKVIDTTWH